jgi:hypothetical protein
VCVVCKRDRCCLQYLRGTARREPSRNGGRRLAPQSRPATPARKTRRVSRCQSIDSLWGSAWTILHSAQELSHPIEAMKCCAFCPPAAINGSTGSNPRPSHSSEWSTKTSFLCASNRLAQCQPSYPRTRAKQARPSKNHGETFCGTIHPKMLGTRCGDSQAGQVAMFDGKPAQAMHAGTTSATLCLLARRH